MQTQSPENFGNEYRQRLQQINSQAYNEAAQEQAERNANRPQGGEKEPAAKGTGARGEKNVPESPYKIGDEVELYNTDSNNNKIGGTKKYKITGYDKDRDVWEVTDDNGSPFELPTPYIDKFIIKPIEKNEVEIPADSITEQEFNAETNSQDKISGEKDEWGKPLIKASDGSVNYGEIGEGYGLQAAPIRLSLGENKKNPETGKDEGYGLLHIIARHGEQIRKAGYKSVQEFVEAVSKGYTEIREGVQIGTTQTYLIVKKYGHANTLYIELSRDGKYWNVNSAGIFKERYVNRKNEIKPEPTVGSSTSTDTTGVNHGQTEGATVTSGNSPMISTGKDTHNSPSGNGSEATLTFEDGTSVPMKADSKGRNVADYSQMTPEHGAEWIKRSFGENADKVVDGKIKKAEAALKEAEKIKIDYSADDADIIEAEAKKKEAVDAAQRDLDFFTRVKNAMNKKENLEAAGGTGATGGRYEQWRKDGYYIGEGGVRYDRQKKEDQTGVYGREVKVDFAPKVSAKGRAKVVEIDSVQASRKNGQANPWHFGPDWQPKDRTDEASLLGQNEALNHFDPEKITGDGNAYIESAPSVNERHEVIQATIGRRYCASCMTVSLKTQPNTSSGS